MNLYEFQIRAFATTFLLLALYALERRRFGPFLLWSLLALGCRSDVGLVLAGMGVYASYELRVQSAELSITPMTIGNSKLKTQNFELCGSLNFEFLTLNYVTCNWRADTHAALNRPQYFLAWQDQS